MIDINKKLQLESFINKLLENNVCADIKKGEKDLGLLNEFYEKSFLNNFPDIWFDWSTRLDSKLMIIGQNRGPMTAMEKIKDNYLNEATENPTKRKEIWNNYINNPKDRTTKKLKKYIKESAEERNIQLSNNYMDNVFLTVAVFFARKGKHFRGNHNFAPEISANLCLPLLEEQINIVKPKLIMTLGNLALTSIASLAGVTLDNTLTKSIEKIDRDKGYFKYKDIVVIPNFHPAAHVKKDQYMKHYFKIWDYIQSL